MSAEQYRANASAFVAGMDWCWVVAAHLARLRLGPLLEVAEAAHAAGPVVSPTVYQDTSPMLEADIRLIRALAAAQRELLECVPSLRELSERT